MAERKQGASLSSGSNAAVHKAHLTSIIYMILVLHKFHPKQNTDPSAVLVKYFQQPKLKHHY